jgi:hypothetical protein
VRVTLALLARYAETEPDGGLLNIIGGGTDVFGVAELPVEFSMPFALALRFDEPEADTPILVSMVIRGPDLQDLGPDTDFSIIPTLGAYHAPGWEGVFYIAGVIGLYAEQHGGHSIGIRLDGIEAGVIPFQIISPDPPADDVDA